MFCISLENTGSASLIHSINIFKHKMYAIQGVSFWGFNIYKWGQGKEKALSRGTEQNSLRD